ncbi:codanin-1-like [Lineus longissimus]|uniref:codanin-1-like n=1 Tax=Lineus longissimus TaxID=88925 RepID=UPI00315D1C77
MAAILEMLLKEQTPPSLLIPWLCKNTKDNETPHDFVQYAKLRTEFVPFFLNYLRDQSLPLLQSSRSLNPSPAKTPTNLKLKKKCDILKHGTSGSKKAGGNRVQLFSASPLENKPGRPDVFSLASPNSSLDSPSLLEWSNKKGTAGPRKGAFNRTSPQHDWAQKGQQKQSPNYVTPDHQRFKYRQTLGDFLATPDGSDYKKKKSPHWNKTETNDGSPNPSPRMQRRSGSKGKKNGAGSSESATRVMKVTPVASPPIFSLNNLDDFPPVSLGPVTDTQKSTDTSSNPIITPSRRITPTPIKQNPTPNTNTGGRRISLTTIETRPVEKTSDINPAFRNPQVKTVNFDEEREIIRKEIIAKRNEAVSDGGDSSQSSGRNSPNLSTITPTKARLQRLCSFTDTVIADRSAVTYEDKLDVLIRIYSGILNEPLVSNITVELYFLVQLLTVRGCPEEEQATTQDACADEDELVYFNTVHNTVFFATSVLERQKQFLSLLDRSTLRLLVDNPRISQFTPSLRDVLAVAYESMSVKAFPSQPTAICNRISFQADTDNKGNFPTDKSFYLFKKQRDMFYELLREWEDNHLNPDWSMQEQMTGRIQALVNCGSELTNHIHFARLFQSQLIEMCKGDGSLRLEGGEDSVALLAKLKQSNPEKFKRLQERFITPNSMNGPSPPPSFQGCQKFFRTFIMASCNFTFNKHLSESIYCKICELNNVQLPLPEADAQDGIVDQESKDVFVTTVLTLRLLGKFLGFIIFLPYQTPEKLPEAIVSSVIETRNLTQSFQVDLLSFLRCCVRDGRISFTLPWVVEYLSMSDPIAISLDSIKAVMVLLIQIYKTCKREFHRKSGNIAMLLVIVLLGWLFEIPAFPDGLFFTYDELDDLEMATGDSSLALDNLDFVDHQLLYTCCPYLGEVRSLLVEFAVGLSSRTNQIRKITPVSADSEVQTSVSEKQMQDQLEENFFHNHPASMKKCVEFVADRVASNYIKRFRAKVLPEYLGTGTENISLLVGDLVLGKYDQKTKERLGVKLLDLCETLADKARVNGINSAPEYCEEHVATILPQMLPEDISEGVLKMAAQISQRLAIERVQQWMNTLITTNMVNKELSPELDKQIKNRTFVKVFQEAKLGVRDAEKDHATTDILVHNPDQIPPSDALTHLKDLTLDILLFKHEPTKEDCVKVLDDIYASLTTRQDVILAMQRSFGLLTKDLACNMASSCPHNLTADVIERLVKIWRGPLYDYIQPHAFLCYKHVYALDGASNYMECWDAYGRLIKAVVEAQLVSPQCLGKCVLTIIQEPLELDTLERLSELVCDVVQTLGKAVMPEELIQGVEWLLQLCGEASTITSPLSEMMEKMKLARNENCHENKKEEHSITEIVGSVRVT